eukprot:362542-Chlamydomonas_euryale.AAC.1
MMHMVGPCCGQGQTSGPRTFVYMRTRGSPVVPRGGLLQHPDQLHEHAGELHEHAGERACACVLSGTPPDVNLFPSHLKSVPSNLIVHVLPAQPTYQHSCIGDVCQLIRQDIFSKGKHEGPKYS